MSAQPDPSTPLSDHLSTPELIQVEDILTAAIRGWWLLVVFILLGALAGWGISRFRPTLYETSFTILTSLDLTNTGEQTQFEEDLGMEAVGQVIGSSNLYERVAAAALKAGIRLDAREMLASATLERRMGTWRARLRGNDPQRIERIAAIWRTLAVADLNEAYQHARVADGLQRRQLSLEACLNQSPFNQPSSGLCAPSTLRAMQSQLRASTRLIAEERAGSHGLTSGIVIDWLPQPVLPAAAVLYRRGEFAAAGGLIGLILGVWAVQSRVAGRLLRRKRA